jgi:hypothetical protein
VIAWRYRHDTLILESVHELAGGSVRVIDFMPPRGRMPEIDQHRLRPRQRTRPAIPPMTGKPRLTP